jgi:serine/threonine-protein phosphatase 2A activator
MPVEGALPGSPNPGDIAKKNVVDRERKHNMYFSAVGFINDVKTGPFWEHSPILFDISGVRSGWGKINKVPLEIDLGVKITLLTVTGHDQDV